MRGTVAKFLIGLSITAIGMFGADGFLGTWRLNVAKSKSTTTNPIKSRIEVFEETADGGVRVTRTEQRAEGATRNYSFTYKYDGKEYPVNGAPFDTISAKRIDAKTTVTETKKTGGPYHQISRYVYSTDGKTKTASVSGPDSTGNNVVSTYVYDKQ